MKDIIECYEESTEQNYYKALQPNGKLKCGCGKIFNPDKEGGTVSSNPYEMPVCENCFEEWKANKIGGKK